MTVWINGKQENVPEGMTLRDLMERFHLNEKTVVVELNRTVIDRGSYSRTSLSQNDTLEIVHFVGGG